VIEYAILGVASFIFIFVVGGLGMLRLVQLLRNRRPSSAPGRVSLLDLIEEHYDAMDRKTRQAKLEALLDKLFADEPPKPGGPPPKS
jgi:hypothetical protein